MLQSHVLIDMLSVFSVFKAYDQFFFHFSALHLIY